MTSVAYSNFSPGRTSSPTPAMNDTLNKPDVPRPKQQTNPAVTGKLVLPANHPNSSTPSLRKFSRESTQQKVSTVQDRATPQTTKPDDNVSNFSGAGDTRTSGQKSTSSDQSLTRRLTGSWSSKSGDRRNSVPLGRVGETLASGNDVRSVDAGGLYESNTTVPSATPHKLVEKPKPRGTTNDSHPSATPLPVHSPAMLAEPVRDGTAHITRMNRVEPEPLIPPETYSTEREQVLYTSQPKAKPPSIVPHVFDENPRGIVDDSRMNAMQQRLQGLDNMANLPRGESARNVEATQREPVHPEPVETEEQVIQELEPIPSGNEMLSRTEETPDGVPGKNSKFAGFTVPGFLKRKPRPPTNQDDSWRKSLRKVLHSRAVTVQTEDLSADDVIIAVMGPTGAGKSSFINMATGNDTGVGHDLESCTTEIRILKSQYMERSDLDVIFVDTPGFDDTNKSDKEILEMVANWLESTYKRNVKLAGILYFHRISDNRMAGTPLKNLHMFEKLCGRNALKNIVLTTTMWDELGDEEDVGIQRERELREKYWKGMIEAGSKTVRYRNTWDSAWSIVDQFLEQANERYAVELQAEMVEMEKQLPETKAGKELYTKLEALVKKQQETLKKIRAAIKRHADESILNALREEYEDLQKQLAHTVSDMQSLKIPIGRRILRLFAAPLGFLKKIW